MGVRGAAMLAVAIVLVVLLAAEGSTALATLPFVVALHFLKTFLGWVELAWRL